MFHPDICNVVIPQTYKEIENIIYKTKQSEFVYFDTETSGKRVRVAGHDFMIGLAIGFDDVIDENIYYIPFNHFFEGRDEYSVLDRIDAVKKVFPTFDSDFPHFTPELIDKNCYNMPIEEIMTLFKPVLEKGKNTLVAHNMMFDLHVLQNHGINVEKLVGKVDVNQPYKRIYDTILARQLLNQDSPKKLEYISKELFGLTKCELSDIHKTLLGVEKKKYNIVSLEKDEDNAKVVYPSQYIQIPIMGQYSGEDVFMLKPFKVHFDEEMEKHNLTEQYYQLRTPYLPSIWRMERKGIKFDSELAKEMTKKAEEEQEKLLYTMYETAGIEINVKSSQQLYELLFGFKKKIKDKKTGGYKESFNQHILDKSFNYEYDPDRVTDGGKDKDKNLKTPKVDKDAIKDILKTPTQNKRQEEGKQFLRAYQKYVLIDKLRSTYMVGQGELVYSDGRIHPSFNITGTTSGRLSCSDPNLQNLTKALEYPKKPQEGASEDEILKYNEEMDTYNYWHQFEIRRLYRADSDDRCLISADYSALERRISAHFSEDPNLIEMILGGHDPHSFVSKLIFKKELDKVDIKDVKKYYPTLRGMGKQVGFAVDYQGTSYTVKKSLKCSENEAQGYIDAYWEGFKHLKKWADGQIAYARKNGYVCTLFGRKRFLNNINSQRNLKMRARGILSTEDRLAVNSPVQGTAAEVMIKAQILIDNDPIIKATKTFIMLQVHDEFVSSVLKKYRRLIELRKQEIMANCLPEPLLIPLKAETDYGETYAEAK